MASHVDLTHICNNPCPVHDADGRDGEVPEAAGPQVPQAGRTDTGPGTSSIVHLDITAPALLITPH